jgi:DNA-binding protein WhiA
MSFSRDVKNEICRARPTKPCDALAECYGILLYCNTFSAAEVRLITENEKLAERVTALFGECFGVGFDDTRLPESGKRSLIITDKRKLETVFGAFGLAPEDTVSHHINLGVLEEDCCRAAFLRGAFLAGGSVTDPGKGYHLELVTPHRSVSRETVSLLQEQDFSPKTTGRAGNYIVYFKHSAAIEDFLTLVGASGSAMELMSAKIEKDMRNSVNRRVNCDTANVSKTVDAAAAHLDAIARLDLETLPEKLRETARLRLENPELSLTELAELFDPPVTKSGLNHRFRRLAELARD